MTSNVETPPMRELKCGQSIKCVKCGDSTQLRQAFCITNSDGFVCLDTIREIRNIYIAICNSGKHFERVKVVD